ncbi:MAG TPA: hypothetical protein VLE49_20080 [Anaerolineales bacterium]|nr:hypothetical protein [Anaerolineales bacterium]
MFSRIRIAIGIALLVTMITSSIASAKGNFAFISITSPNLKEAVRSTDPALTTDFLAFFDFSDKAEAPTNPGVGYLITRYYVDGKRETAFDHLHYYPDTGFVYYDGIVNGSSDYDGKWYTARPEIKPAFEKALPGNPKAAAPAAQVPVTAPEQAKSNSAFFQTQSVALIAAIAGLLIVLLLAVRFRKPATR